MGVTPGTRHTGQTRSEPIDSKHSAEATPNSGEENYDWNRAEEDGDLRIYQQDKLETRDSRHFVMSEDQLRSSEVGASTGCVKQVPVRKIRPSKL